jgi:hypothetical protein
MRSCSSCRKISRRELLAGAAGASAFRLLSRRADAQTRTLDVTPRNTARSCIFILLDGAPSHLDTFDPKDGPWNPPDADLQEHPGGIVLSQTLFPGLSRFTSDLLVLHSVESWELAHDRGLFYMQTSHASNPAFVSETPHIGAVVAAERGDTGPLPAFLAPNGINTMQGATFLGGRVEPMIAPANQGGLSTLAHNFYGAQSQQRFNEKYRLLQELDAPLRGAPYSEAMGSQASFYDSSRKLMYDPAISAVFQLSADDVGRYGGNAFGNAAIVARNAVRAKNGTSFVNLRLGGWDTHQNMYDRNYAPNMYTLVGQLDRALAPLVEDLKASGDLDQTLIVVMGEFGRTPGPLNGRGGRDHHKTMSVAMLGGGVKGGRTIGKTDSTGDQIIEPGWSMDRKIYIEDVTSTIYSALGVNWTKTITDTPSGRRFEYVPSALTGKYTEIAEVFG